MSALASGQAVPPTAAMGNPSEQQHVAVRTGSRLLDLVATAKVGVSASVLVAGEIATRSVKVARVVLPTGMGEAVFETIERQVRGREQEARRTEQQGLGDVASAAESVLNRVVVEIVDMLDMEQLIDMCPSTGSSPGSICLQSSTQSTFRGSSAKPPDRSRWGVP